MIFSKKNKNYLGETEDQTKNTVHGFHIKDSIYIVLNMGTEEQIVSSKKLSDIENEQDKFMWTPYSIFVARLNKKIK